jgi:DNA repair protein RecO (recombination protein O)
VALVTDDAVILSVSDYSETSQIACLFTRLNGRLNVLAKGSKRPKSAFGGPLDRFLCLQAVFSLRRRGGLGTLAESSIELDTSGLGRDLGAFYAASYMAELVRLCTEELDPHPALFKTLCETLTGLSRRGNSAILLYRFEMRLLAEVGVRPQLGACVSCGKARPAGQPGRFDPNAGGLACRRCRAQGSSGVTVSGKALDALDFLADAGNEAAGRVRLAPETAGEMRKLLDAYWPYVAGRVPRSAKWIR